MNDVIGNINWVEFLGSLWTIFLVPILSYLAGEVNDYLKAKKIDKYTDILYEETKKAVKCVYETVVKDVKSTSDWTPEKQVEVKELAKTKAIQGLSAAAYRILKEANGDFDEYLDNLIGTVLYDVKHE